MKRWIYFILHFVGGFLILWLTYKVALEDLLPRHGASLLLTTAINTSYLVCGVIWGNVGWDTFKNFKEERWSFLPYALSQTLAPVIITFPVIIIALEVFFQGQYLSWRIACTLTNVFFLGLVVVNFVLLLLYKRSERNFFYSAWGK